MSALHTATSEDLVIHTVGSQMFPYDRVSWIYAPANYSQFMSPSKQLEDIPFYRCTVN